jgi:hypothetical protein
MRLVIVDAADGIRYMKAADMVGHDVPVVYSTLGDFAPYCDV